MLLIFGTPYSVILNDDHKAGWQSLEPDLVFTWKCVFQGIGRKLVHDESDANRLPGVEHHFAPAPSIAPKPKASGHRSTASSAPPSSASSASSSMNGASDGTTRNPCSSCHSRIRTVSSGSSKKVT